MNQNLERALSADRLGHLPVFPLAGGVLIPQGFLPLHVFEPRYVTMVDDCLAADGVMAVASVTDRGEFGLDRHGPSVRNMAGVGVVKMHERLPDDRRLIVLRGVGRVRLLEELDAGRAYRVMRAEPVCCAEGARAATTESMSVMRELLRQLVERTPDNAAQPLLEACLRESHAGRLVDLVGATVIGDGRVRQRLLEELDVGRRMDRVCRELAALLACLEPEGAMVAN